MLISVWNVKIFSIETVRGVVDDTCEIYRQYLHRSGTETLLQWRESLSSVCGPREKSESETKNITGLTIQSRQKNLQ